MHDVADQEAVPHRQIRAECSYKVVAATETPSFHQDFLTLLPPPEVSGRIKSKPTDFQVTEALEFQPTGSGEHVYLRIRKTGANTGWVSHRLAAFCDLRDMDVSYAGRKDRHAVTEQWFSCYLPGDQNPDWGTFREEGVEILEVTRHTSKLRRGQIECNHFDITVQHDPIHVTQRMELIERLVLLKKKGFPNYFGEQRFGVDRANLINADKLMAGDRKQKSRGMLMSAARSWLFNQYLSSQIAAGAKAADGGEGPLFGRSRDPQVGEDQLDEQGRKWLQALAKLKVSAGTRALFVKPDGIRWQQMPDALQITFSLPSGAYATSLLRELFLLESADGV